MFQTLLENLHLQSINTRIDAYLPKLAGALFLLLAFWIILIASRKLLSAALRQSRVPESTRNLLVRFVRYAIVTIAGLTVASQLGINITSLVAGLGIAGLAISFAAQDTIANLISGITLAIDRPFKVGDWILIGDIHASVAEIRLRTTVLTTFDNESIVMPNKTLAQERIVNYTLTPRSRVRVAVRIAYKESIPEARETLLSIIQGDERILADPAPIVIVAQLDNSSVNLELRFWTQDPLQKFPLLWEYTEKAKQALDRAGIQIPFPHLQLFLEPNQGLAELAGT